ncbi:hypothetical protein LUZ60_013727 [Juncus effusus]|nr:hypothetical protein LUZ60_013727 [Juncus effusus]
MNGDSPEPSVHLRRHKRLLFDRRYGWIVDEWKDPSEEALAGGRGMFCVVPIAKSLVEISSKLVNLGVIQANNVLNKHNKSCTGSSNADKPSWFSEIEKLGLTAKLNLEASRNESSSL